MTEELIGVAVAAASAVLAINKGLAYLWEKRNERNGNNPGYVTQRQLTSLRDEWKEWCAEKHRFLDVQRIETKANGKQEINEISRKIESVKNELQFEILRLSTKMDEFLKLIPK